MASYLDSLLPAALKNTPCLQPSTQRDPLKHCPFISLIYADPSNDSSSTQSQSQTSFNGPTIETLHDLTPPTPQYLLALIILSTSAHSDLTTWASWMFSKQTKSTAAPVPLDLHLPACSPHTSTWLPFDQFQVPSQMAPSQ